MERTRLLHLAPALTVSALLLLAISFPACAQEECEDRIAGWAVGDTIYVAHDGAYYNCCAVIVVRMELPEPYAVDFLESETFPYDPCFCMCCFGITMWGSGFGPGLYTVRVWNDSRTVLYGETQVLVEGPPFFHPELVAFDQTKCGETTSVGRGDPPEDPDSPGTWGCIKLLYR